MFTAAAAAVVIVIVIIIFIIIIIIIISSQWFGWISKRTGHWWGTSYSLFCWKLSNYMAHIKYYCSLHKNM